jgi:predicted exporter
MPVPGRHRVSPSDLQLGSIRRGSRIHTPLCPRECSFGGLALSGYKGLQGLGIAAIGGTAVALLTTQWLLPWILEKWPLRK